MSAPRSFAGRMARASMMAALLGAAAPSQAARLIQNDTTGQVTAGAAVSCDDPGGFTAWTTPRTNWRFNTAGQGAGKGPALRAAMDAWTNVEGASHVLAYAGTTTAGFDVDWVNSIGWGTDNGCSENCLALTALVLETGQRIVEVDITFNADYTWSTNGTGYDTQSVAAHELGHALGIHHTEIDWAPLPTMYAYYSQGTTGPRTLEDDDREALRCVQTRLWAPQSILWQADDGQLAVWFMLNGDLVRPTYPGLVDGSWQIQGVGDFDGFGEGDILWRHDTGQVAIWYMSGGVKVAEAYPGGQDPGLTWQIQAVADFDGDRHADILWRHAAGQLAIWYWGNDAWAVYPGVASDASWQIKGAADFDRNGSADILWRHTSGQVAIWYMSGGAYIGAAYPGGQDPSLSWTIQGTGDFDADGRSDILWRANNGQVAIWFRGDANLAAYPGYQNVPGPVPLDWQIQGVRDFNADGRRDILWRHSGGQLGIWFMNGGQFAGEAYPALVDNGWQVKRLFQDQ